MAAVNLIESEGEPLEQVNSDRTWTVVVQTAGFAIAVIYTQVLQQNGAYKTHLSCPSCGNFGEQMRHFW